MPRVTSMRYHPFGPCPLVIGRRRAAAARVPPWHDAGVPEDQALRGLVGELLGVLRERSGFALVMLTRVAGDTFRWQDSICSRMAARDEPSPWALPDVATDADAAAAPVRDLLAIRSYAGVPLRGPDGSLVGTLCAIDPDTREPAAASDLFAFAERFAGYVLDREASAAADERRAERRLLRGDGTGPLIVPKASWRSLLEAEAERTRWSGERLTVALVRVADHGAERPMPVARLAEHLAAAVGPDDAVAVLGSNRVGVLAVDRSWDQLASAVEDVAESLRGHGVLLRSMVAVVDGPGDPIAVCDELEAMLVGEPAATARSASELVRYGFCDECGRKGRYRRPGRTDSRCKYCGAADAPPARGVTAGPGPSGSMGG
jgi:hypothetical protein